MWSLLRPLVPGRVTAGAEAYPIVTTEQDYMNIEKTMTSVAGNIDKFIQKDCLPPLRLMAPDVCFNAAFTLVFFFLTQWPTVSEWGQISVRFSFFVVFLR